MALSQRALQAALAQWTDEVFLECLTFEHTSIATPVRLVNDRQDLVRSSGTHIAFPFQARLSARSEENLGLAEITADNVDQRIVEALRGISDRPTVTYEAVLAATPDVVEYGPVTFNVVGMVVSQATVSLTISFAMDLLRQSFPKDWFAPWNSSAS